ncbi:ABC transporter permease subunit [Duganella sp. FT92W]|uniref:ABC transporter permease subunit n=1 Tax=Pseudoduganella rivuli TaxID=2666085 RepID=A0A7X2IQK7_9BURK|nr:sugar ABC transporter permease [Pseudoduganella rivuli]MRV74361.1 ABC transporter permease subunit [Pseudoduganella rivuli]
MSGFALHRSHPANGLFVLPFVVTYAVLVLWPLLKGVAISLQDYDLLSNDSFYVGMQNFVELGSDDGFRRVVWNTLTFVAISTPVFVVVSLALALALNRPGKLCAILRGTFFSASVFSVTIVTLVWNLALMPERGLIAQLLAFLGLPEVTPLASDWLALPMLAVVTVWWIIGLPMIVFLAALQQIPADIYEAAALDNTSRWRTLTRITLPMMSRTIALVAVIEIIRQAQVFPQMWLMTGGGPNNSTRSIVQFVYEQAYMDLSLGYASAASHVLFAAMLLGVSLQLWLERERKAPQ